MPRKRQNTSPNLVNPKLKRKKLKVKRKGINLDEIQLPLENRFNILDTAETNDNENNSTPNKLKIAPIVVTDANKNIQNIIADLNIKCDIKIVSVGEKIFAHSTEDKKRITDELIAKKINFFSHPEIDTKIFKVIVSGLPQIEIAEIENDLKETYNITASKIIMFNTQSHNKLYLCHFNKSEVNIKTLNTIKVIYQHIIKWQPFKPQANSPTQCYRCCMYGHGARSCNRFAVCSLCSGNHTSKECTVITPNTENPVYKCFNCASTNLPNNHKANDINCPFRAKYVAAKEKARDKNKQKSTPAQRYEPIQHQHHVLAPQPPPLKISFADATAQRNTQTHKPSTSTSNTSSLHSFSSSNSSNNLWSFAEVSQLLRQSINELKQCKSKFDQLNVIANLLQHACD